MRRPAGTVPEQDKTLPHANRGKLSHDSARDVGITNNRSAFAQHAGLCSGRGQGDPGFFLVSAEQDQHLTDRVDRLGLGLAADVGGNGIA